MRKPRPRRKVAARGIAGRLSSKSNSTLRAEQLENRLLLSVNDLVWNGTSGADQVLFEQIDAATIRVTETLLNGVPTNNITVHTGIDGRVIASGLGGNDLLDASGLVNTESTLNGGAGSNTLRGGAAADLLIGGSNGGEGAQASHTISGGAGDDTIYGNAQIGAEGSTGGNHLIQGGDGNDTIYGSYGSVQKSNGDPSLNSKGGQSLIVGGAGSDTIYASQASDGAEGGKGCILVAGSTTFDDAELATILSEWTSTRTLNEKLDNNAGVGAGPRNNGDNFLQAGVTVFSDHTPDHTFSDTNGAANWLIDTSGPDTANRVKAADIHNDVQVGQAIWINPAGGFWDEAFNWQDGYLPGPGDIAVLNAGANTITFRTGTVTVLGIQNSGPLALTGGELTVTDTVELGANLQMAGGTLRNAVVNAAPGAKIVTTSVTPGALDGVTINGDLEIGTGTAHGTTLNIRHGLTANGTVTIGVNTFYSQLWFEQSGGPGDQSFLGTANVVLGVNAANGIFNNTAATLTLGAGITINGGSGGIQSAGGASQTINLGQIELSGSGKQFLVFDKFVNRGEISFSDNALLLVASSTGGWTNEAGGSIQGNNAIIRLTAPSTGGIANSAGSQIVVNGGELRIAGYNGSDNVPWQNDGTIQVTNAAVYLSGSFTQAGLGNFIRSGGSVRIIGVVDGDVTLNASTGDWILQASSTYGGGTLRAGTLTLLDGAKLQLDGAHSATKLGTLDGMTINGDLNVSDFTLTIKNGLVLNGSLSLGSSDGAKRGSVTASGAQSITGNGTLRFNPLNTGVTKSSLAGSSVTIGPGITLAGRDGTISANVANQGTINADGGLLTFSGAENSNSGLIETLAGGSLSFTNLPQNDGTIQLAENTSLTIDSAIANAGAIDLAAGALLTIGQSLSNAAGASISLEIGGPTIEQQARLIVTGAATLDGTLTASLINGFVPADGQAVGWFRFANRTGQFATLVSNNGDLEPVYGDNAVAVVIPTGNPLVGQAVWINPAGGQWSDLANWENGKLPVDGDAVDLTTANSLVTFDAGVVSLASLVLDAPLNVSGGALSVPSLSTSHLVTINGGTLNLADGTSAAFPLTITSGTLQVTGDFDLQQTLTMTGGSLIVDGSLTVAGAVSLAGATATLAVADNMHAADTLAWSGGNFNVDGNLTIDGAAVGTSGSLSVGGDAMMNGTLNLERKLTTTGVFNPTYTVTPSHLYVTGNLEMHDTLTIAGGQLHDATLLLLDGAQVSVPVVYHGGVNHSGGIPIDQTVQETSGTLDNVTIASDLTISGHRQYVVRNGFFVHQYPYLTIANGLTLNANLNLGNSAGSGGLRFTGSPAQLLDGTGSVTFGPSSVNSLTGNFTIGAGMLVHGDKGSIRGLSSSDVVTNQGTISADVVGGTFSLGTTGGFINQGTVQAAGGAITAKFSAPNEGIVAAKAGSTLTISGAYTQAATGTTRIEVAGTAASQYGKVNVTGAATLAGLLQIVYADGFSPANNDAFNVLGHASRTGTFDTIDGSGVTFTPAYGPTTLTLTAVVP